MPIPELTIADRVQICMRRNGDTVTALAEHLGLHRISVQRRLSGDYVWRAPELLALAQRYDVPVGWLMGEEVAP